MQDYPLNERPRRIVQLASELSKASEVKDWLFRDENGTWEKMAAELLGKYSAQALADGISEADLDKGIAGSLRLAALTTCINASSSKKR